MLEVERIPDLISQCKKYKLSGAELLNRYTPFELANIANGIGPECFPDVIRKLLDKMHPSLVVVSLIHDVRYDIGGEDKDFDLANEEFAVNGKKVAFGKYGWYNPIRYIVWRKAVHFAKVCQLFGKCAWKEVIKETEKCEK